MTTTPPRRDGFDRAAAVTRSLLGYGVLVGAFYLVVGIAQAVVRGGFDFREHPLSILMLGDFGWIQRVNLIVSGLMVIAAAVGFARATRGSSRGRLVPGLIGAYGVALIASGIFEPDPMDDFPPGAESGDGTVSGALHLAFGGIGFLCLAVAAFVFAAWCAGRDEHGRARSSRIAGTIVLIGFLVGAALATQVVGVVSLWIAVVAGWAWLAVASVHVYRTVPHPDAHRRA